MLRCDWPRRSDCRDVTVRILDRPRQSELIKEAREAGTYSSHLRQQGTSAARSRCLLKRCAYVRVTTSHSNQPSQLPWQGTADLWQEPAAARSYDRGSHMCKLLALAKSSVKTLQWCMPGLLVGFLLTGAHSVCARATNATYSCLSTCRY
jgi:hypothetical protein